jgi:glycosyltransferase involved in cell wall biosynthesis
MDKPLVSIIALNFNQAQFLVESLDAIAGQTYTNFEIIITDDASKDESRVRINDWISKHPDLKVIKLFNDENSGLCKILNEAIKRSSGKYIKPIACDDILDPSYLEKTTELLMHSPEYSLVCTDMQLIDEHSVMLQASNWKYAGVIMDEQRINKLEEYTEGPFLNTPSLLFTRDLFDRLDGYDEDLVFEDWDFILRAKNIAKFAFIEESLVSYRMHSANMHKNIGRQVRYSMDIIKLLKKHLNTSDSIDFKIRKRICDEIFSILLIDEKEAISLWSGLYHDIKPKNNDTSQPLLSVLTSVYNSEDYIAHALDCVLLQTYTNIQLVIVTDPCTDRTIDIIKEYVAKDQRVVLIENTEHLGIISSFNRALDHCSGDYIARMDLDDLIHPQRFERQMDFLLTNPKEDVVSSWMKIFDEKKAIRNVTYRSDFDLNKITMLFYSPISHAASVFKASVLKNTGYIEDYKYAEDYDLWFRIMKNYRIAVLPEYLYLYRTHSNQVTNEKNLQIIRNSLRRIAVNLLGSIGVEYSDSELEFHLEYLMLNKAIDSPELFIQYDTWLGKVLDANRKSGYLAEQKFTDFVFTNYWQSYYLNFRKDLKYTELIKMLNSEFNQYGIKQKSKDIIKQVLNK